MRWTQDEVLDGVAVTRVAMYPSHDRSAARRILSYLSLGLSMLIHLAMMRERFDLCYVYLGPITLLWPAALLRRTTGAKVVADVQDIWPQSVSDSGMLRGGMARRILNWVTHWSYGQAGRFIVLSPGYRNDLVSRGFDPGAMEVVYNWTDETPSLPSSSEDLEQYFVPGKFTVLYAGNIGRLQSLGTALDAMKILAARGSDCRLALVGDGVAFSQLAGRIDSESLTNVVLHPRVGASAARRLQERADALLVHLLPSELTRIGIPQKVQASMAAGRPILAAVEGEAARLVRQADCGVVCAPGDSNAMADAVEAMERMGRQGLDQMGQRGRTYYRRELAFDKGVERILDFLEK